MADIRTFSRGLVGQGPAMRRVLELAQKAAESDATVLLLGETGTGKEATTELVHRASRRRDGPLAVVDCGAVAPQLLASELFGHERGSFTGATSARKGAFEAAAGGTVLLDEIGELDLELQPKLLRVLERREVKRVGSNAYIPVDVRVVAATHRDLRKEVAAGRFRADLYYRLAVITVQLPALRERLDDLPALIETLLGSIAMNDPSADPRNLAALKSPVYVAELARYGWPGNIRELRNHLERCVALGEPLPAAGPETAEFDTLEIAPGTGPDADLAIDVTIPFKEARQQWVRTFERRYLQALLESCEGSVSTAARIAGVDRVHLYRLLWKHGLRQRDAA